MASTVAQGFSHGSTAHPIDSKICVIATQCLFILRNDVDAA
jgi:hypothetical protein